MENKWNEGIFTGMSCMQKQSPYIFSMYTTDNIENQWLWERKKEIVKNILHEKKETYKELYYQSKNTCKFHKKNTSKLRPPKLTGLFCL